MNDTCIFEYQSSPGYGCAGMPGGYSICIFVSGNVVRRDYVLEEETPEKETIPATIPELARRICAIIEGHLQELKSIPGELNNGSPDGSHDCFRFGEKRISAWHIQRTDPAEIRHHNPRYYEPFRDNMKYENSVLDIYDEIAREINRHNVGVQMDSL